MSKKIGVLVVDDSMMMRRMVSKALTSDPSIEVIGEAGDGEVAMKLLETLKPDLVVLDLEMPRLDGHQTTVAIRRLYKDLPIIIFSSGSYHGAKATFDTLHDGANDFVAKPQTTSGVQETRNEIRESLLPKVRALTTKTSSHATQLAKRMGLDSRPAQRIRQSRVDIITIASSTGGPEALTEVLRALPANLPVPVVCVQHMPANFSRAFADRVNGYSELHVKEAEDHDVISAGGVWIAPGNAHIKLRQYGTTIKIRTDDGPPVHHCRPAADVLFETIPKIYNDHVLSIVLTGMGKDGLAGCEAIHAAGGRVLAQDQATSVVWGMPGAVTNAGITEQVLPLDRIAAAALKIVKHKRHL